MNDWDNIIDKLDYAQQSIVKISSGVVYGYEALLCKYTEAGFSNIEDVFNKAYRQKQLYYLNLKLKVVKKFKQLPFSRDVKVFYNLDPRILQMLEYSSGNTEKVLNKYGLNRGEFCFEISEKYEIEEWDTFEEIMKLYTGGYGRPR